MIRYASFTVGFFMLADFIAYLGEPVINRPAQIATFTTSFAVYALATLITRKAN